jgi:hypothetical protein
MRLIHYPDEMVPRIAAGELAIAALSQGDRVVV